MLGAQQNGARFSKPALDRHVKTGLEAGGASMLQVVQSVFHVLPDLILSLCRYRSKILVLGEEGALTLMVFFVTVRFSG